jgi:hypothetical protein
MYVSDKRSGLFSDNNSDVAKCFIKFKISKMFSFLNWTYCNPISGFKTKHVHPQYPQHSTAKTNNSRNNYSQPKSAKTNHNQPQPTQTSHS